MSSSPSSFGARTVIPTSRMRKSRLRETAWPAQAHRQNVAELGQQNTCSSRDGPWPRPLFHVLDCLPGRVSCFRAGSRLWGSWRLPIMLFASRTRPPWFRAGSSCLSWAPEGSLHLSHHYPSILEKRVSPQCPDEPTIIALPSPTAYPFPLNGDGPFKSRHLLPALLDHLSPRISSSLGLL